MRPVWRCLLPCLAPLAVACASTSTIHTKPVGAEVYINGERCGASPCIRHSRYGFPDRMRIQLEKPGYRTAEFFVDTEAPVASYALFGFGSYVFHSFAEEYEFELEAAEAAPPQGAPVSTGTEDGDALPGPDHPETAAAKTGGRALDAEALVNAIDQCLYWVAQASTAGAGPFFEASAHRDCLEVAERVRAIPKESRREPSLAAALERFAACPAKYRTVTP